MIDATLAIAGQAGQGIDTASELVARAMCRSGYYVFSYPNIMSRIRGGHNFSSVRVSDRAVQSPARKFNVLLALDELSVSEHRGDMADGGVIVAEVAAKVTSGNDEVRKATGDGRPANGVPQSAGLFRVPMAELAAKHGGSKTMVNVVGLGAMFALTGHPLDALLDLLKERFRAKGDEVVKQNVECCRAGADFVRQSFGGTCACAIPEASGKSRGLVLAGSHAIALGALAGGVKFYAGYPMSPATPIMEYLAGKQLEFSLVMEQAEDEIAAVNMIVGASYAGARAMTATSGGGFSLMVEGLGLAGMAEIPIVIVVATRPGPATGFPTRTEQAELLYVLNTSQDEFPRFVFAPGAAEEAYYMTARAFELAARYQVPAIVLSDQFLSDSLWTVPGLNPQPVARGMDLAEAEWRGKPAYTYRRYALTRDGVSPRLAPGFPGQSVRSLGAEHTEDGFQTEEATVRKQMHEKRMRKLEPMAASLEDLTCFPAEEDECVVACFGSTYGAVREAVTSLCAEKRRIGMVHFCELAPFPKERALARLGQAKKVITVEGNSTGQLAALLRRETGIKVESSILRYDGRPFTGQALAEELRSKCQ